jgi:hypothetical protein
MRCGQTGRLSRQQSLHISAKDDIRKALSEELGTCSPDQKPGECAHRFTGRLATLVNSVPPTLIAEDAALIDVLTPLFEAKQKLDAAHGDAQALAAAGSELLEILGPVPDALAVDDSTFKNVVGRVLDALDQLVGAVAKVPDSL